MRATAVGGPISAALDLSVTDVAPTRSVSISVEKNTTTATQATTAAPSTSAVGSMGTRRSVYLVALVAVRAATTMTSAVPDSVAERKTERSVV